MKRKQTIKEWELETGIRVNNPKGFRGKRNKIHTNKYSEEAFRLGLQKSEISIRTEKVLEFMNGQTVNTFLLECFMDFKNNRKKDKEFKPRYKNRR